MKRLVSFAAACVVTFAASFAILSILAFLTLYVLYVRIPVEGGRGEALWSWVVLDGFIAASVSIGYTVAYPLLHFGPRGKLQNQWFIVPLGVALLSVAFLYLQVSPWIANLLRYRLPPGHFGMTNLFVGVLIVSFLSTLLLRLIDWISVGYETPWHHNA